MIRNLKALGLALVAVFAMSAIAASGASATDATFSWDESTVELKATDDPSDPSQALSITGGAIGFTCDEVHLDFNVEGINDVSELTATGVTYTDSTKEADKCRGPFGTSPSVKMNGCSYNFKAGTTIGEEADGHATGTVDIHCPEGKVIETSAPGCLYKWGSQTDVGDVTYRTVKTGEFEEVTVEFRIHAGMTHAPNTTSYSHSGFLCGTGSGSNGTYTGKVTVQGFDKNGNQTNVTIT